MSPRASIHGTPRSDERRRTARHTVTAIIYVHLGSDNGGIVINVGTGGLAFQAAMRLTAKKDSTLSVRLGGSGLNVELIGEIVWLGASQKEAGIRFKDASIEQQQEIASWITGQEQPRAAISYGDRPWQELPPAIPQPDTPDKSGSYSLASALGMSQTLATDAALKINPSTDDPLVSALLDPDAGRSATKPRLGTIPSLQEDYASTLGEARQQEHDALASPAPSGIERRTAPTAHIAPMEPVEKNPAGNLSGVAHPGEVIFSVPQELPRSAADWPVEVKPSTPQETKPVPRERIFRPIELPRETGLAERWIPPALLAIWRNGALYHKLLLVGGGVAGVGFFAVALTLAVAHLGGPFGHAASSEAPQQPGVQTPAPIPHATTVSFDPNPGSASPIQQPPLVAPVAPVQQLTEPEAAPRHAPKPQPSTLARLTKTLFGFSNSDENTIDDDQLRVQVWTSKTNGYYYCTDNSFYQSVHPGKFMTQGDALQNGYRPILRQFCN